ncbi:gamma-butyrobetaine hydroxylase-like domain-containing protein [Dongia sp.]|uniref:gamma-butyrobetaine hydroxylase-like domain-containing protein n=1 Tax=Dongia sp. TaxID=1977262 RepID=UPI0035AFA026
MSDTLGTEHWPVEIRHRQAEKLLEIEFDDGKVFQYPAELLRVESPSAEVKGHGPGQKTIVPGRRHVGIMKIEPVGRYAIRIDFDDMHDTGIYTWRYLYELGRDKDRIWQGYLDALAQHGLSRDPRAVKAPAKAHDRDGGCGSGGCGCR